MAIVALIPTGKMEHLALAPALHRIFPEHTFVVRPTEAHLDGFTSTDARKLTEGRQLDVETKLDELVAKLLNTIFGSRRSDRVDYAFVLEDLELCNQHQPDVVIEVFKKAVETYIARYWPQSDKHRREIHSRCSFHLFRPMTEAYLFGDDSALDRARIARRPQLSQNVDLEFFQTDDSEYLNLPARATFPEKVRKVFKDHPDRERHPKSYLQFLCDPTMRNEKVRYQETDQGCAALSGLNWESVLGHPSKCPFLTAFMDDLSEALNCSLSFIRHENADVRLRVDASKQVLRNI